MLWFVCKSKVRLTLARTRVGEGGGALASSLYTILTNLQVFQDTDDSRFPPRKSSPLIDDAVASWHGFIMTLLLIMICRFSLAQSDCCFLLSPVELPVPQWGEGTTLFHTSLLWSLPSLRVSRESETCPVYSYVQERRRSASLWGYELWGAVKTPWQMWVVAGQWSGLKGCKTLQWNVLPGGGE